jgi:hypothetical protein
LRKAILDSIKENGRKNCRQSRRKDPTIFCHFHFSCLSKPLGVKISANYSGCHTLKTPQLSNVTACKKSGTISLRDGFVITLVNIQLQ